MQTSYIPYNGYQLLTITSYGSAPYDAVFLVPHGYQGEEFQKTFPQTEVFFEGVSEEIKEKYLSEEADLYSPELAHEYAQKVQSLHKSAAVIEVNMDRGICDANRIEPHGVRKFIDFEKHHEVVGLLRDMNNFSREKITNFLKENLKNSGWFMDVHTMGCYSRIISPSQFETPGNIAEYTKFLSSRDTRKGPKRSINILTEHEGKKVMSHNLDEKFFRFCSIHQLPICYNDPYSLPPKFASHAYHHLFTGISIDVPRYLAGTKLLRKKIVEAVEVML